MISIREAVENQTVVRLVAAPPEPSACAALGISERHARALAKSGAIPSMKIGKRIMVPTSWLRSVLAGEIPLEGEQWHQGAA
jgi:hypothetical protein